MLFSSSKQDGQHAKAKPVGRLPFAGAPKCGLYSIETPQADQPQTTDTPNVATPSTERYLSLLALRQRVRDAAASSTAPPPDHFDVLSVSAATPVPCVDCGLAVQLSSKTIAYTVNTKYSLGALKTPSREPGRPATELAFLFPFSECGPGADSFEVLVEGQPLFGEIVRVRRRDGRLIASTHHKCFLAETSDMSDEENLSVPDAPTSDAKEPSSSSDIATMLQPQKETQLTDGGRSSRRSDMKLLYMYVVERSMLQFVVQDLERAGHDSIKIEVRWRCKISPCVDANRTDPLFVPFSYYCAPRMPNRIACHAEFAEGTQVLVVKSPNCRGALSLRVHINGPMADAQVECIAGDGRRNTQDFAAYRHAQDYLWVFEFYFGQAPKSREEISLWGVTCILAVAALALWYFLTKDLEL